MKTSIEIKIMFLLVIICFLNFYFKPFIFEAVVFLISTNLIIAMITFEKIIKLIKPKR